MAWTWGITLMCEQGWSVTTNRTILRMNLLGEYIEMGIVSHNGVVCILATEGSEGDILCMPMGGGVNNMTGHLLVSDNFNPTRAVTLREWSFLGRQEYVPMTNTSYVAVLHCSLANPHWCPLDSNFSVSEQITSDSEVHIVTINSSES